MIRKMLLTAAVVAVVVPAADVQAQAASGNVSATATVADYVVLTGTDNLSFGTVARGADAVISAVGGAATRSLTYNRNVTVTFSSLTALTGTGGSLPITMYCATQTGAAAWVGETNPCTTGPIDLDVGASTTTTTLGFGGRIAAAAIDAARAGTYSGTMDITVTVR